MGEHQRPCRGAAEMWRTEEAGGVNLWCKHGGRGGGGGGEGDNRGNGGA